MPIICTNRSERLTARFPAEPSYEASALASLWKTAKAEMLMATGESLHTALVLFDTMVTEFLSAPEDDAVAEIYFHRLTNAEIEELVEANSDRGVMKNQSYWLQVCQRAIDGWNDQVLDADLNPIPVPTGDRQQTQRQKIAALVAEFPDVVLPVVATLARSHIPDELKKTYNARYRATSSSPIGAPDTSSPVPIAANGTTDGPTNAHRVTPEA